METIFLSPAPMPYLTDCNLKRFGINEYHCSRCCGYFVLIFMLKNTLQFTENGILTTLHPGEWYIQRKNIRQDASRPSPKAEYYYIHFEAAYTEDRTNRLMLPVRGDLSARPFPAAPSAAGTPSEPDTVQPSGTTERILQTAGPAVYPGTILYAAHRRPDALPE